MLLVFHGASLLLFFPQYLTPFLQISSPIRTPFCGHGFLHVPVLLDSCEPAIIINKNICASICSVCICSIFQTRAEVFQLVQNSKVMFRIALSLVVAKNKVVREDPLLSLT